jgi:hypothetical protein
LNKKASQTKKNEKQINNNQKKSFPQKSKTTSNSKASKTGKKEDLRKRSTRNTMILQK